MYQLKTKPTDTKVIDFIEQIDHAQKKEDAYKLLDIYTEVTGMEPTMWGPSMIGFGQYHYKYQSGHEGDAMMTGFSPRKSKLTLYLYMEEDDKLLAALGKQTHGIACVYVSRLDQIDLTILKKMILRTIEFVEATYGSDNVIKK